MDMVLYALLKKKISEMGITDDRILKVLTEFLETHPEYIGATEEQAEQIIKNAMDIVMLKENELEPTYEENNKRLNLRGKEMLCPEGWYEIPSETVLGKSGNTILSVKYEDGAPKMFFAFTLNANNKIEYVVTDGKVIVTEGTTPPVPSYFQKSTWLETSFLILTTEFSRNYYNYPLRGVGSRIYSINTAGALGASKPTALDNNETSIVSINNYKLWDNLNYALSVWENFVPTVEKEAEEIFVDDTVYKLADSEARESLANKANKTRIDFDGTSFKLGDKTLNYKELYDIHITQPDFAFIVYGDRAYLLSYVQDDAGMKEMRFQSTIAVTNSEGLSNVKTSDIYVISSDGINIASVRIADINSENEGYKASVIDDSNKDSEVYYPSNKAVNELVKSNAIKPTYDEEKKRLNLRGEEKRIPNGWYNCSASTGKGWINDGYLIGSSDWYQGFNGNTNIYACILGNSAPSFGTNIYYIWFDDSGSHSDQMIMNICDKDGKTVAGVQVLNFNKTYRYSDKTLYYDSATFTGSTYKYDIPPSGYATKEEALRAWIDITPPEKETEEIFIDDTVYKIQDTEARDSIGDISQLETEADNLVDAINEIHTFLNSIGNAEDLEV